MARIVALAMNRYGLSFAENKTDGTYSGSGRRFASYYRMVCTRCGFPFAGPRWKQHNHKDCDSIREQDRRGDFKRIGIPSLRRKFLHGE